jgi:WD40 repeat protein
MDATIRVWNPKTGKLLSQLTGHSSLVGLLKVNGDYMVAGSTDGSISFWNARTLKNIRHIENAHRSSVTAIDFNRFAVVSGSEKTLCLWPLNPTTLNLRDQDRYDYNKLTLEKLGDERILSVGEPVYLTDRVDVVWRIVMGDTHLTVGYQEAGLTLLDVYNFSPSTQA